MKSPIITEDNKCSGKWRKERIMHYITQKKVENYMHGGGPSPSGSNFRHSYGFAAVSSAHTSANARFPGTMHQIIA